MSPNQPDRIGGCVATAFGTVFSLIAGLFLVVAILGEFGVIRVERDGPGWLFFAFPAVFLLVGVLVFRFGWSNLTRPRPGPVAPPPAMPLEATRAVLPILVGFLLTAAVSIGGVVVAQFVLKAPGWVVPIVFFLPAVVFAILMRSHFRTLTARLARAVPSPESQATPTPPRRPAFVPDAPDPVPMSADWPTVPHVETRPGRVLRTGLLPAGMPAGCAFGCAVGVTLFWNGVVSVFLWQVVESFRRGDPDWFHTLFLVPFVLVGLGMIGFAVYTGFRWVVSLLVGRVEVEVSAHPLAPGGRYDLHVAQRGLFGLGGVGVELVCVESATYVAGTSKSTATRVVARHPVEAEDAGGRLPLTARLEVPPGAMHSFDAPNNEINWKVRVTGRALGVLPFSGEFAVAMHPAGDEAPAEPADDEEGGA